jgi:hypothetical protein
MDNPLIDEVPSIPGRLSLLYGQCLVSVTRRTTIRDSVNVVDDFYDIYA